MSVPSRFNIVVLAAIFLSGAFAAGCGGGDGNQNPTPDVEEETEAPVEDAPAEEIPELHSLSFTSPLDGAVLTQTATIAFTYDTVPDSITVYLDSTQIGSLTAEPMEITLDTTAQGDGSHQLTATGTWGEASADAAPVTMTIDNLAPEADESSFMMYSVVAGAEAVVPLTITDAGGLARIEIIRGTEVIAVIAEAPFDPVIDATAFEDGPIAVFMRISDLAGHMVITSELPLLVVNDGTIITLDEGDPESDWTSMQVTVPSDPLSAELDLKDHWTMPAGTTRILSAGVIDGENWTTQYDLGIGFCPHSGESKKSDSGNRGGHVITLDASELGLTEFVAGDQWFAHFKPVNASDHIGDTFLVHNIVILYGN